MPNVILQLQKGKRYQTYSGYTVIITECTIERYYRYAGYVMNGTQFIRTAQYTPNGICKTRLNSNHLTKEL